MDLVHDRLLDGRHFRVRTVIDQWSRESVSVDSLGHPTPSEYPMNGQKPERRSGEILLPDLRVPGRRSDVAAASTSSDTPGTGDARTPIQSCRTATTSN
jgi:hypothetical protein